MKNLNNFSTMKTTAPHSFPSKFNLMLKKKKNTKHTQTFPEIEEGRAFPNSFYKASVVKIEKEKKKTKTIIKKKKIIDYSS